MTMLQRIRTSAWFKRREYVLWLIVAVFCAALLFRHAITRQYCTIRYRLELNGYYTSDKHDRDGWVIYLQTLTAWNHGHRRSVVAAIKDALRSTRPDRRRRAVQSLGGMSESEEFRVLFRDETPEFSIDASDRVIFRKQVREHFPDRVPGGAYNHPW